jgi:hypothetical protein
MGEAVERGHRVGVRSGAAIAALVVAYAVLPFRGDRWWLGALIGLGVLMATIPYTLRRIQAVLVSPRPIVEAAEALAVLLTMIIVGFAALYFAIDRLDGQFDGLATRVDAIYFTVTTLSTVGYGDITASSQGARVAVTFQMVFDVLFIGIAARVLVTAAGKGSR